MFDKMKNARRFANKFKMGKLINIKGTFMKDPALISNKISKKLAKAVNKISKSKRINKKKYEKKRKYSLFKIQSQIKKIEESGKFLYSPVAKTYLLIPNKSKFPDGSKITLLELEKLVKNISKDLQILMKNTCNEPKIKKILQELLKGLNNI